MLSYHTNFVFRDLFYSAKFLKSDDTNMMTWTVLINSCENACEWNLHGSLDIIKVNHISSRIKVLYVASISLGGFFNLSITGTLCLSKLICWICLKNSKYNIIDERNYDKTLLLFRSFSVALFGKKHCDRKIRCKLYNLEKILGKSLYCNKIRTYHRYFFLEKMGGIIASKSGVLRNFAKFTGNHLWPKACNFIKKRLWRRCFPLNFASFLRTPFTTEHLQTTASEFE